MRPRLWLPLLLAARTVGLAPPLAAIVVTSPARSHPSTEMLWTVVDSLDRHVGAGRAPLDVLVVADGFRTPEQTDLGAEHAARVARRLAKDPLQSSKQGLVSAEQGQRYARYKAQLRADIAARGVANRVTLLELDEYAGFAFAVKAGLEALSARGCRFALVCQHDRLMIGEFPCALLDRVLNEFDRTPALRYVGLPTSTSRNHADVLEKQYRLASLVDARSVSLGPVDGGEDPAVVLRPCIFWWDSNHIVDIARAIQLFAPFSNRPPGLLERLGGSALRKFVLRKGDFIEDKLGQAQRNFLMGLGDEPDELLRYFDWFGSYLLELTHDAAASGGPAASSPLRPAPDPPVDQSPGIPGGERKPPRVFVDKLGRQALVAHINGRGRKTAPAWSQVGSNSAAGGSGSREDDEEAGAVCTGEA